MAEILARVLVVDDCADTRMMIVSRFEQLGAHVTTAPDGALAIQLVKASIEERRPFQLLIMDIRMPGINGMTTSREIRDLGFNGVIAACTATSTGEGRKESKHSGIDLYFDKNVFKKDLAAALLQRAKDNYP